VNRPLFEAVPNFSEGRDEGKISRITAAVRDVANVRVLDLHSDPDHNRSVLTFAGGEEAVLEAAVILAGACADEIDLVAQAGEHPRMGALDVLPFVPLEGATLGDAVGLARKAGERIGAIGLPVYLYEAAATAPHRCNLADIRRGGYEGLAARIEDPAGGPTSARRSSTPARGPWPSAPAAS
jgi:glutamate formiminotransferase